MEGSEVKKYYRQGDVVDWYARAANNVGLWNSEEEVFEREFGKDDPILEIGCGAGRIAVGLWENGYRNIVAIDFSREMVEAARHIAKVFDYGIEFRHGDATGLKFPDESFSGAIFGFNGLMQIPKRSNRFLAMQEAYRVLKPGSTFVFTTHDRESSRRRKHWQAERAIWNKGEQEQELDEFGDVYRETEFGYMYIHSPLRDEIHEDIKKAGFKVKMEKPRSSIANEPLRVRDFSDDCRFWVVNKPKGSSATVNPAESDK